ncbi:MAG: CotH kinase family protein, partial [Eubacterium sp.]|nr:CotH kinase family protein [Eubacterium sp.]
MNKLAKRFLGIFTAAAVTCTGMLSPMAKPALAAGQVVFETGVDRETTMNVDGYTFDHEYVKPGDTLQVLKNGSPVVTDVNWTVYQVAAGKKNDSVTYNQVASLKGSSLAIKDEYLECLIYGEVDGKKLTIYCSKTPVIYMNSETDYYDVTKADYSDVSMNLVGNDDCKDSKYWYQGDASIKLRGNSTTDREKRPFKLKLGKKTDLLNLGDEDGESVKSKHWVLLANDIDHSLLRNKLLMDLSGEMGTDPYMHSTNVTLIYNGQYEGVYQLCEHRRIDNGRIDITNWKKIGEKAAEAIANAEASKKGLTADETATLTSNLETAAERDYTWIDSGELTDATTSTTYKFSNYGISIPATKDGGYLVEMDFYSFTDATLPKIQTAYGQPMYVSLPEPTAGRVFMGTSLYKYAAQYTQTFEYALHSPDFTFHNSGTKYEFSNARAGNYNPSYTTASYTDTTNDGKHYSDLFDMESLVNNFIFCEYAMNWDSMKNSFFYYKESGQKAVIAPQWDFDWCWGNVNMYNINTNMPTVWQTTSDYFAREQTYQHYQWNRMLIRDPYFLTKAYERYQQVRPLIENMIKSGGLIDQYQKKLAEAGAMNDKRWSYTYTGYYYFGGQPEGFADSISSIRTFLSKRVAWLDKNFKSVETLMDSLKYYEANGDVGISVTQKDGKATITATCLDPDADLLVFQVNGK